MHTGSLPKHDVMGPVTRLFGTFHMPRGRWPSAYGLARGEHVPGGYVRQLVEPLRPARQT